MRVFFSEGTIYNCQDESPLARRFVEVGTEEIPISIFGDYAHLASSENTIKRDGEWTFDFDAAAYEVAEAGRRSEGVRAERDRLIAGSDWTQLPDFPLNSEVKTAWAIYRQALRDIPQQAGFPDSVEWPEEPVAID